MTSRLYVQKRGPSGGSDIELTAFTGRKGTPFFDDNTPLVQLGMRCEAGEASQGTFLLTDPIAELPKGDFTYNLPAHALVTWTEDAPGSEIWLSRGRIASADGGRGDVLIDDEVEFEVVVDDGNVDLRGQAFTAAWVRPEETDYARLVALQAYTLNGASSTATWHRDTCDVTISSTHLAPNTGTVTMPAKKYLPGTQPADVIRDCAEMAAKFYGVVIHHTGGSHLCLLYILPDNHTTYLSAAKISDQVSEWDPEDLTAPVWEPHWEMGKASLYDGQTILSGLVSTYGPETSVFNRYALNEESYDYWVEAYSDGKSTTSSQASTRGAALLDTRKLTHVSHRVSAIILADQVDLIATGMSIQIKATAALGGQYLNTWQTRRIAELQFEPRTDGRYWAHMHLDRPVRSRLPNGGGPGPIPPVQSEPPNEAVIDHYWSFTSSIYDDGTSTYPGASPSSSVWHPNYVHSHVTMPGVGNVSQSPHAPVSPGVYHFRAGFGRNSGTPYNPGGVSLDVYAFPSASVVATLGPVTSYGEILEEDVTFPGGTTSFGFEIPFNESFIDFVELSHGGGGDSFVGTATPLAPSGPTGVLGTSPYYSPSDHQHAAQTAEVTPIADAGGYFAGDNVEEALQELGSGSGVSSFFNVKNYGATGDGTTDDTSSINDAIDALVAAGSGVLYFPAGTYKTTAALTTLSVPCVVRGDGSNDYDGNSPISLVTCTSDTANLFTVTADHAKFENIALQNTEGNPSAGSAISTQGAFLEQRVDYESIVVHSFYIGIDVQVGAQWSMRDCFIYDPVLYGVKIRNTVNADAGDWVISDTEISADSRAATAGIRIESSGGGKIASVKINMGYPADQKFTNGIDVAVTTGIVTVVLLVTNCSIENVTGDGIKVVSTGTGEWKLLNFHGNQFGLYSNNTGKAINIAPTNTGDVGNIVIANNLFHTTGTARTAVQLTNVDNVVLVGNVISGFNGTYTETTSTNVVEIGGDLSAHLADTTDAHDASAVSIVDAGSYFTGTDVEAALQELGAGGSFGNAVGPILIIDTPAGSPLVFADLLQNEAGTDLLYEEP